MLHLWSWCISSGVCESKPQSWSIRSCYGYISSIKNSITVPSWVEFKVSATKEGAGYAFPKGNHTWVDTHNDPALSSDEFEITKIATPWVIEVNKNVQIACCSHILNTSGMHIPSGVINFKNTHQLNIFNYVHKYQHEYSVGFKKPLLSLYPMTTEKFYLETYYDRSRFEELNHRSSTRPFFMGSRIKLDRFIDGSLPKWFFICYCRNNYLYGKNNDILLIWIY